MPFTYINFFKIKQRKFPLNVVTSIKGELIRGLKLV